MSILLRFLAIFLSSLRHLLRPSFHEPLRYVKMHADGDTALEVKRRQLVLNFIALLNFSLVFYLRVSGNKRRAVSYKCGCVCQNVQEGVMENA